MSIDQNPSPSPLSRRKRILFGVITALLLGTVCAGIAEGLVRVFLPEVDLQKLTGITPSVNPMAQWAHTDAFCAFRGRPGAYPLPRRKVRKTINSQGFISTPEIDFDKPEGTVRLAFLGGSSTAGTGYNLGDDETWPWKTTAQLSAALPGKQIDFINASMGGYSSFESYGRLWARLRPYNPDIIVVYHGWNEMYYFLEPDKTRVLRTLEDGSWGIAEWTPTIAIVEPHALDWLWRRSQVTSHLRALSAPEPGEVGAGSPAASDELKHPLATRWDPRALDIWRHNLRLIRETSRLMGVELFVAKQATLIVPDLPEEQRQRCAVRYHGFDFDTHIKAFDAIYRVIDEEIPKDHIIDVTSISGRPLLFSDHVHPMPEGATMIASIIAEALITNSQSFAP